MRTNISMRDWEALSAYLDGQLTTKESTHLEARVKKEPELRHLLEVLSQTRAALHSQPKLRTPRNFTLTPEMAGIQPGARSAPNPYPLLRLASALATVLFVLVSIGDLATRSIQSNRLVTTEAGIQEIAPVMSPLEGVGGGVMEQEADVPVEKFVETEVEIPLEVADRAIEVTPEIAEELGVVAAPVKQNKEKAIPTPEVNIEIDVEADTTFDLEKETTVESETRVSRITLKSFIRSIQILLAFLAVGTGLMAVLVRRSSGV